MKRIAILGSTGSIGTQALDVIRQHADLFEANVLTAGNNADLLIKQAREFLPNAVVIANEDKYEMVKQALEDLPIKVFTDGYGRLCRAAPHGGCNQGAQSAGFGQQGNTGGGWQHHRTIMHRKQSAYFPCRQ